MEISFDQYMGFTGASVAQRVCAILIASRQYSEVSSHRFKCQTTNQISNSHITVMNNQQVAILLPPTNPLPPILTNPRRINNLNLLSQTHHRAPLIPPPLLPRTLVFSLRVRQTLAGNNNRAPNPSTQLRDAVAVRSGKVLGHVNELRAEVLEDLHVAGLSCEGQDVRGVRDEGQGLLVEGVEGFGVRGF
jgi:hypothetical protein